MSLPVSWPELEDRWYGTGEMLAAMNEAYAEGRADEEEHLALLEREHREEVRVAEGKKRPGQRLRVLYEYLGTLLEDGDLDEEDQAVILDGRETLAALIVERCPDSAAPAA